MDGRNNTFDKTPEQSFPINFESSTNANSFFYPPNTPQNTPSVDATATINAERKTDLTTDELPLPPLPLPSYPPPEPTEEAPTMSSPSYRL